MKKRAIGLMLALAMLGGLLPLNALAADGHSPVRVTGSGSDFLTGYYVTYELNGVEYRSDRVGQAINRRAWANMSDSDRRAALRVFAFAPDYRKEQFGETGSAEMTGWINEKQGWTALWETYAKRIEDQQCGPLKEYYADENYSTVVAELENNVVGDSSDSESVFNQLGLYDEYPETREFFDKYRMIGGLMSSGKSAYGCIVRAYEKAREASVKAVSKELISIIVDKSLTPNITVAPTAATTGIYTNLADLFAAVTGYSDSLTQKVVGKTQDCMGAVEVMNAMRELAQLNYQLAAHCYRQAKQLSDSLPAEAERVLAICKARRESDGHVEKAEESKQVLQAEQQARWEAEVAESDPKLYEQTSGSDVPVWDAPAGLTAEQYDQRFRSYTSGVNSYISSKRTDFKKAYDQLYADYRYWYNNCKKALDHLDEIAWSSPWPEGYYRYRLGDPNAIFAQYIYLNDEELRDYQACVKEYADWLREMGGHAEEFMEASKAYLNAAVEEYGELVARARALYKANQEGVTYVTEVSYIDGSVRARTTVNLYTEDWDIFDTKEDDGERDHSKDLLDTLTQRADVYDASKIFSYEYTAQLVEQYRDELVKRRSDHLAQINKHIAEYNSARGNYDLAIQFGEQMRDRQDAVLQNVPDYVRELKGNLVRSTTTNGVVQYYIPYDASYGNVTEASPKLASMLEGASDPLAKARSLGAGLVRLLDEYDRLQRCIDNARTSAEFYKNEMDRIAYIYELNRYDTGFASVTARHKYDGEDYSSFLSYLRRSRTEQQLHDLSALRLLAADLSGWGANQMALSLKCAELKATKSAVIARLQGMSADDARMTVNNMRMELMNAYAGLYRSSFYGYACDLAARNGKQATGDAYGDSLTLLDEIQAGYSTYVVPTGIGKAGVVMLLADEPDMILAGVGDRGRLKAVVTPDDATEKGVVWESLDPEIIEVDENGVVLAVAEGEGAVRARALDAPAEAVYEGSEVVDYTYGEEYYVTFTVRVDASAFKASAAAGSEAYVWRNFGTDSAPRFTKATKLDGVTTVAAAYQAEPDQSLLCLALYDADGCLLALSTAVNNGTENALAASTDKTPASARLFLLNPDMTPAAVPPIDETLN